MKIISIQCLSFLPILSLLPCVYVFLYACMRVWNCYQKLQEIKVSSKNSPKRGNKKSYCIPLQNYVVRVIAASQLFSFSFWTELHTIRNDYLFCNMMFPFHSLVSCFDDTIKFCFPFLYWFRGERKGGWRCFKGSMLIYHGSIWLWLETMWIDNIKKYFPFPQGIQLLQLHPRFILNSAI
jgi:hypothetical protein